MKYLDLLAEVERLEVGNTPGAALTKLTEGGFVSFVSELPGHFKQENAAACVPTAEHPAELPALETRPVAPAPLALFADKTAQDREPQHRSDRAVEMCRRVAVAIGREAPAGLGHWEEAWERVNAPSAAFLDALKQWEQTGAEEAKTEVERTAEAVLLAWREAARQWERAGRPAGRAS